MILRKNYPCRHNRTPKQAWAVVEISQHENTTPRAISSQQQSQKSIQRQLEYLQTGISFSKEIKIHTMKMEKNYNVNVELSKNSYDQNSAKPYDVNSSVNS